MRKKMAFSYGSLRTVSNLPANDSPALVQESGLKRMDLVERILNAISRIFTKTIPVAPHGLGCPKSVLIGQYASLYTGNVRQCSVYLYQTNKRYVMFHRLALVGDDDCQFNGLSNTALSLDQGESVCRIIILQSDQSGPGYTPIELQERFPTAVIKQLNAPFDPTEHRKCFACRLYGTGDLIVEAGTAGCYKIKAFS